MLKGEDIMVVTKKVKLSVVGDKDEVRRVYDYIRNGCYAQNTAYNYLMSAVYSSYRLNESPEARKELYQMGSRTKGSSKGSLYDNLDIEFAVGLGSAGQVGNAVRQDMQAQIKAGLFKGHISLRNKKLDAPLIIGSGRFLDFYSDYESDDEVFGNCMDKDFKVFIKFVNGIRFRVIFGNPSSSGDLRIAVAKILCGEYKACGSSIQIKDNKIFLNLTIDIGKPVDIELDDKIAVGCHIGFNSPIICACTSEKKTQIIGNTNGFIEQRIRIQQRHRELQAQLKYTRGGHGRKNKLAKLDHINAREANFAKTTNHQWSAEIVKYAIKNKAKYINLEVISRNDVDKYTLRNWSYYQLQEFIKYKANKNGITVRFVKMPLGSEGLDNKSDELIAKDIANATEFISEKKIKAEETI